MSKLLFGIFAFLNLSFLTHPCFAESKPNMIVIIADDMGWNDTGFSGNQKLKTPAIDDMASRGIWFDYFYAAGAMCCPGRYAILTGRAPLRGGINDNEKIRPHEIILPRVLREGAGYATAYFGKWHLGRDGTSPVGMGYEHATWIMNQFNLDPEFEVDDTKKKILKKGEGSVATMELAIEHIRKQATTKKPFFVTIGFASPHVPHISDPEYKKFHPQLREAEAEFAGEIAGIDAALGMLRKEVRRLGIADNTLIWFMSDNGGVGLASKDPAGRGKFKIGARTTAVLEWPGRITRPIRLTVPCSQVDVFPTLLELAGVRQPSQPIIDGASLVPLFDGKSNIRPGPLGFLLMKVKYNRADFVKEGEGIWIDGKYELCVQPVDYKEGDRITLYDIYKDPKHKENLASQLPDVVERMRTALENWQRSVRFSFEKKDFPKKANKSGNDKR